jgi:hypothetical protein
MRISSTRTFLLWVVACCTALAWTVSPIEAADSKPTIGTEENQSCKDEGPLTLERSKTVDEEISAKVIDWLDRNDPEKTNKPFFCWYNPARMHVTTVLSDKYLNMLGEKGGKDWGAQRSRHEADGRQHRLRAEEARRHGRAGQHDHRLHHRQRR